MVSPEDELVAQLKAQFEQQLGWGPGSGWTNQEFEELSERILAKTGVHLSTMTLKRIWGRVQYSSAPSTNTLNTLSRFMDYGNWRAFRATQALSAEPSSQSVESEQINRSQPTTSQPRPNRLAYLIVGLLLAGLTGLGWAVYPLLPVARLTSPEHYGFRSQPVVDRGVPNSVVFDIDARQAPVDSVVVEQSWDPRLQTKLDRHQRQHTAIYYYPGHFTAKLRVGNRIVRQHPLLIPSDGWLPLIEQWPVPIYLRQEEALCAGELAITSEQVREKSVLPAGRLPFVAFYNTRDFGAIYSDSFTFETVVRNTYSEGAGACQKTYVMLQCVDHLIWIPLCAKGCVSDINVQFANYCLSGKRANLKAFGVDFGRSVKLRIEAKAGTAQVFVNDRLGLTINAVPKARIVGIGYRFQGAGAVDYVKLSNDQLSVEEYFE